MDLPIRHPVILRVFPMERMPDDPDPTRGGVNMPIGAEVLGVKSSGGGIPVIALCPAGSAPERVAPRAWHGIQVAPADDMVTPLMARAFGAPLGVLEIGGRPCAILPDLPWPVHPRADG